MLDLWKYVQISKLQREHGIQDSVIEDTVPLTAAALLNRSIEETEEEVPLISERVKVNNYYQLQVCCEVGQWCISSRKYWPAG